MKDKRVIMYDVSDGNRRFYAATTLPTGVKDPSTIVYNTTIGLFPDIDSRYLNIITHGNNLISCFVEVEMGIVVKFKPLISCVCENIEFYENGNAFYRNTWIIRFGEMGSKDKYGYVVPNVKAEKAGTLNCFNSLEDAYEFIDKRN